ncbi:uncharacterized protein GBIM_11943 [Gryllus bimaculatus]|nr:uncharacterized protein GBIM_11943 [Gryllus bimaculatus]
MPDLALTLVSLPARSTDSGWDNPFRPDGNLSKEADEIVELIKGGKPITPTSGAAPAPAADAQPAADGAAVVDGASPVSASPQHAAAPGSPTAVAHTVPQQNNAKVGANGNAATAPGGGGGGGGAGGGVADGQKAPATPGNLEVQRGTVDPSQAVEHVVLKKKQKCKCCVIQ